MLCICIPHVLLCKCFVTCFLTCFLTCLKSLEDFIHPQCLLEIRETMEKGAAFELKRKIGGMDDIIDEVLRVIMEWHEAEQNHSYWL